MKLKLKQIIREEYNKILKEEEIIPTGPDGRKIEDPRTIKNLNMALKAVHTSIRPKIIQMIQDPSSAKTLTNSSQRAAVIGAIAIAFGITEQEFGQIVNKIKGILKQ
jgi:hypothetical protein